MPTKTDNLKSAIAELNETWEYHPDSKDRWVITNVGDCEDYGLGVVWLYSGESRWAYAWNILFSGDFEFYFTYIGESGHMVVRYVPEDKYFDNNFRSLVPKEWMETNINPYTIKDKPYSGFKVFMLSFLSWIKGGEFKEG